MANIERLEHVMRLVDAAAGHGMWEQNTWVSIVKGEGRSLDFEGQHFCGTAGCFAGWGAFMDGWKPAFTVMPEGTLWPTKVDDEYAIATDLIKDNKVLSVDEIREWAMDYFDLTKWEANLLFYSFNSLETLHAMVRRLAAGEPIDGDVDDEDDDDWNVTAD